MVNEYIYLEKKMNKNLTTGIVYEKKHSLFSTLGLGSTLRSICNVCEF